MLKKLRAGLGNALTWAAAWGLWGLGLTALAYILGPAGGTPFWEVVPGLVGRPALWGFLAGGTFSTVLGTIFRHKTLDELRPSSMAFWGAVAGTAFPLCLLAVVASIGFGPIPLAAVLAGTLFYGIPGLATAYGTVRIAQTAAAKLESTGSADLLPDPDSSG